MERIEYRDVVDKSTWPDGPWKDEPDKIQWPDAETGLPCIVRRGPTGILCGYVGVPAKHKWFGCSYDEIDVDVHGGITYGGPCQGGDENESVCHVPGPGESDEVWWLGFDCGHLYDYAPLLEVIFKDGVYKDVAFVQAECASLAKQIKNASK